jgi:hypothetical protein
LSCSSCSSSRIFFIRSWLALSSCSRTCNIYTKITHNAFYCFGLRPFPLQSFCLREQSSQRAANNFKISRANMQRKLNVVQLISMSMHTKADREGWDWTPISKVETCSLCPCGKNDCNGKRPLH